MWRIPPIRKGASDTSGGSPGSGKGRGSSLLLGLLLLGLLLCGLVLLSMWAFRAAPPMQDLSQADPVKVDHLLAAWQQGNLILVLRHLERCDRADVPCLNDDPNGITQRSTEVGRGLAEDFLSLGLDHADIYYSPLARTAQTAAVVFGERAEARDWLYHCRQDDSLLGAALEFKLAARNLILVTHSSCIDAFERQLGFSSDTPAYGTALFLTKEQPRRDLRLFGLVEPEDWEQIFFSD